MVKTINIPGASNSSSDIVAAGVPARRGAGLPLSRCSPGESGSSAGKTVHQSDMGFVFGRSAVSLSRRERDRVRENTSQTHREHFQQNAVKMLARLLFLFPALLHHVPVH